MPPALGGVVVAVVERPRALAVAPPLPPVRAAGRLAAPAPPVVRGGRGESSDMVFVVALGLVVLWRARERKRKKKEALL